MLRSRFVNHIALAALCLLVGSAVSRAGGTTHMLITNSHEVSEWKKRNLPLRSVEGTDRIAVLTTEGGATRAVLLTTGGPIRLSFDVALADVATFPPRPGVVYPTAPPIDLGAPGLSPEAKRALQLCQHVVDSNESPRCFRLFVSSTQDVVLAEFGVAQGKLAQTEDWRQVAIHADSKSLTVHTLDMQHLEDDPERLGFLVAIGTELNASPGMPLPATCELLAARFDARAREFNVCTSDRWVVWPESAAAPRLSKFFAANSDIQKRLEAHKGCLEVSSPEHEWLVAAPSWETLKAACMITDVATRDAGWAQHPRMYATDLAKP